MTASNSRQRLCTGQRARLLSSVGSLETNASGDVCESVADGAADVIPVAQLKLVPQLFRSEPQLEPPDLTGVAVAEVYGTVAAGFARGVPDRQPAKLVALDDFGAFVINSDLAVGDGPGP